jgi:putative DNA primase/helicase
VRAASDEYFKEEDRLGLFIEECCETAPDLKAAAKAIFQKYKSWCEQRNEHAGSQTALTQALKDRGFEHGRSGATGTVFFGLHPYDN